MLKCEQAVYWEDLIALLGVLTEVNNFQLTLIRDNRVENAKSVAKYTTFNNHENEHFEFELTPEKDEDEQLVYNLSLDTQNVNLKKKGESFLSIHDQVDSLRGYLVHLGVFKTDYFLALPALLDKLTGVFATEQMKVQVHIDYKSYSTPFLGVRQLIKIYLQLEDTNEVLKTNALLELALKNGEYTNLPTSAFVIEGLMYLNGGQVDLEPFEYKYESSYVRGTKQEKLVERVFKVITDGLEV